MDGQGRADMVRRFFSGTGSTYDHIVNVTTLGFDGRWKEKIVEKIPARSMRIMDQACGTGILTLKIARKYPHAEVTGVDVTEEYLRIAKERVKESGLRNVELILGRAEDIVPRGGWDCVTSSYLAKYADLDRLVLNIGTMLRPGGAVIMHDFTYPPNRTFARFWGLYFILLQTAGARRYPAWKPAFDGLPGLIRETDWVERLQRLLKEQNFTGLTVEPLTFGTSAIIAAVLPGNRAIIQESR